jgi:dihydroflavonol-4-reductase
MAAKTTGKTKTATKTSSVKRAATKILVTGGTGFLGSHLLRLLAEKDAANLRVLTTAAPAWLAETGVEILSGSITDAKTIEQSVAGVKEIYHLAGKVSRETEDARAMHDIHVRGTRLLCEAARASDVKAIVMASTSGTIAVTADGAETPDEDYPTPLEIISRWPYYASKRYQERAALETFTGANRRLVMLNPSLLLGPGDERLSSTKVVLDFLGRKIKSLPKGGLSFVDARDVAPCFIAAMKRGQHGDRYLLGAANWTFAEFFRRLERVSGVPAPSLSLPSALAVTGAKWLSSFYKQWDYTPPVEPGEVEMAEHFWYLDASKATLELGFTPREPQETLLDTVKYIRQRWLGHNAFKKANFS